MCIIIVYVLIRAPRILDYAIPRGFFALVQAANAACDSIDWAWWPSLTGQGRELGTEAAADTTAAEQHTAIKTHFRLRLAARP